MRNGSAYTYTSCDYLLISLQALEPKNIDKSPLKAANLPVIWVLGMFNLKSMGLYIGFVLS